MKLKQRPEDFVVREGYRFDLAPDGPVWVYRMDKQKVSTLQALERLSKEFAVRRRNLSVCGLKDKQGRTEQLVGVLGGALGPTDVVQAGDLRLKLIGRAAEPLSSDNITANRFEVTVRDLSREEADRVPESVSEVERVGVVNYFDSQRFGFLKHGQGLIGKDLLKGNFENALKRFMAMPSDLDRSDDAKVKKFWSEHWGDWHLRAPGEAAARYAPVLRQLRQDPENFKGAIMHIDRRVRMMMLFELQSLVWNEGVKRYLAKKVPASEMIGLRYQAGALTLPRSLPRELKAELWAKTFPLLAPDSVIEDPEIKAAALEALAAQQLNLKDLVVPATPLFFKHEERPMFVRPGKLRVNPLRGDELNRNRYKVNLSFTLPPGAYATLVVRRTLWFAADGARALTGLGATPFYKAQEERPLPERVKTPDLDEVDDDELDDDDDEALSVKPAAPLPRGQKWGQPLPAEDDRKGPKPARSAAVAAARPKRPFDQRAKAKEPQGTAESSRRTSGKSNKPPMRPPARPHDDASTRAQRRAKLFPQGPKAQPRESAAERAERSSGSPVGETADQPKTPKKGFRERQKERKEAKAARRKPS